MEDSKIREQILSSLKNAENIWNQVRDKIEKAEIKNMSNNTYALGGFVESDIPGFPFLENGQGKVGNFVAMILDIRKATEHLIQALSNSKGVSQLQRVFYETTAVNTMGNLIVSEKSGNITEFLGDGFLALFEATENTISYKVKQVAEDCLFTLQNIVNPILKERYSLPELSIGIGIAHSQAIVTLVEKRYPKVIGECVYRASKLCNGQNEIMYDNSFRLFYPSSKGGKLSFIEKMHKHSENTKGYTIQIS